MDSLKSNCRACFQVFTSQNKIKLTNIIQKYENIQNVTYQDAFFACTGFQLKVMEPQELCEECASELLISYQFKEKCQATQNTLEKLLEESEVIKLEEVVIKVEPLEQFVAEEVVVTEVLLENHQRISCDLCGREYKWAKHLKDHYKIKHKNVPTIPCPHCNKQHFPQLLDEHLKVCRKYKNITEEVVPTVLVESDTKIKCDLCGRAYSKYKHLTEHYKKKHKDHLTDSCPHCDRQQFPQLLDEHLRVCKKRFKRENIKNRTLCPVCGELSTSDHIKKHLGQTDDLPKFICDICGKILNAKGVLKRHMKEIHLKIPVPCKYCVRTFGTGQQMHVHMRKCHPDIKPLLKCKMCDFQCLYHTNMRYHRAKHNGSLTHKCDICHKEFHTKPKLTKHMAIHSSDRPFTCETCGATFKTTVYLASHKRIHRERDYECPVCQRAFLTNQLLTTHVKSQHKGYELPPPGTVMSKSWRRKMAEKKLKEEAKNKGMDKKTVDAIVVTEVPPLEELQLFQPFR